MKTIWKNGAILFGKRVLVAVMSFFVVISISVICNAAFTKEVGYTAYGYREGDTEKKELYTYRFADGEDLKKADYEADGYTVETMTFRSDLSRSGKVTYTAVSQLLCLVLLIGIVYGTVWPIGQKDGSLVRSGRRQADRLKGWKIGLVSSVPAVLLWVAMLVCAFGVLPELPASAYSFLNSTYYPLLQILLRQGTPVGEVGTLRLLVSGLFLLTVPVVSGLSYEIGHRDISISERLIYQKKREKQGR